MKALLLRAYNEFELTEFPEPAIAADEVLVRVKACGICGSDVHGMTGSTGRRIPPIVMGHEASGVIARTGAAVTTWHAGDRVTFDSTVYCGECDFCRAGRFNLCDRRCVLGVSCGDYRRHGAFADFVAVPQRILYRMPDAVPFEQAAMVEALSVAVHAVNRGTPKPGEFVLVIGTGMIGLLVIQVLRARGCGPIIAVDRDAGRLAEARRNGATHTLVASADNLAPQIQQLAGRGGVEVAFEVVGATQPIQLAVDATRKGGRIVLVGNFSPRAELPLQAVVSREITLLGSCSSNGEYPESLELLASGKVNVSSLISAIAPLAEGASWFERLHKTEPGLMKVVLVP